MADGYKLIRPYKYYQPRPWRRPRWHADHKSSKFYHSKRISPEDYYSRRPSYNRYGVGTKFYDTRLVWEIKTISMRFRHVSILNAKRSRLQTMTIKFLIKNFATCLCDFSFNIGIFNLSTFPFLFFILEKCN